jgi:transcriptional regulator with PAS, ATPase and Fis domain
VSKIVGGAPHSGGGGGESLPRDRAAQHYAAIVESSDDAILSKDLNGVITSWNSGAQRLFGYTAEEAVGRSVTIIIPTDRHGEEPMILERVRRGDRIDHYETYDSARMEVSLIFPSLFRRSKMKKARSSALQKSAATSHNSSAPGSDKTFCSGRWTIASRICSRWRSAF